MGRRPGLWILVVLFLALAAWLRYGPKPTADPTAAGPAPFVAVEPTRVARLTVTFDRDTTVMERIGTEWWIVSPIRFPADPVAIEALLNRTRALVPRGVVPNEGGPGDPFGVRNPLVVVSLGLTDGTSVRLDFGNLAPAARAFYMAATGKDSLALIAESEADTYFRRSLDSWREAGLLDFDPAEALDVRLEGPVGRIALARPTADAEWRVLEPFPGRGDDTVIDEYVAGLAAMKARHFPPAAPPGAFERDVRRIVVGVPGRRDTLELSGRAPDGTPPGIDARVAGRPWAYRVPAAYLSVVDRSHLAFRERRFVGQPLRSLGLLRVVSGPDSTEFAPDSTDAWRLLGESGTPGAPPPDRTPLVEAWVRTEADSIVAAGDPLDPFRRPPGNDSRVLRLVLADRDGRTMADWELRPLAGGRPGWAARANPMDPTRLGEVLLVPSDLVLPLEAILAGR
jgi:hypothetical protein